MFPDIPPEIYLIILVTVPAVIGGRLAWGRGLNWPLWGLLCGLFPAILLIVWFSKPRKEVEGYFRRCPDCGEWIKWQEQPCRYCAYRLEQERERATPHREE